jgi:hypothetical protein
MMTKRLLVLSVVFSIALSVPASAQIRWVPGNAGAFTCVTVPTGFGASQIVCDPQKLNSLPPAAREFLLLHESGHAGQIRTNSLAYSSNPEADADCYAATVLAQSNPGLLFEAIRWMETVQRFQGGGDGLHGNGFEVAQFARQCAGRVGVAVPF